MAPFAPIHTNLSVKAFYHEHGVDPDELYDTANIDNIRDTVAEKSLLDPVNSLDC